MGGGGVGGGGEGGGEGGGGEGGGGEGGGGVGGGGVGGGGEGGGDDVGDGDGGGGDGEGGEGLGGGGEGLGGGGDGDGGGGEGLGGGGDGDGGGGEGGGGAVGGRGHFSSWAAWPAKSKLRPVVMQHAAVRVICARQWAQGKAFEKRDILVHLVLPTRRDGAVGCGGVTLTSNWSKSWKKNDTVLDFCTSVRASGLSGLSLPQPASDEQKCPAPRTAAAWRPLRAARRLVGRCARAFIGAESLNFVGAAVIEVDLVDLRRNSG